MRKALKNARTEHLSSSQCAGCYLDFLRLIKKSAGFNPITWELCNFFEAVAKERGPYTQAYEHLLQDTKKRLDKIQDVPDIIESTSCTSIASESANEELLLSWY
jgi:hypothetical protein